MRAIGMFDGGLAAAMAAVVLAGLVLSGAPAMARGFCNIDHLGDKKEQDAVAEAAATFYRGNRTLFQALEYYELGDIEKGSSMLTGRDNGAIVLFQRAGERYQTAAKTVAFKIDKQVAPMELKMVTEAALTGPTPIVQRLFATAQKDGAGALLVECGKASKDMAEATDRFAKETKEMPNREAPYTRLLGKWGEAMYIGRIVSAIFGLAGEKK